MTAATRLVFILILLASCSDGSQPGDSSAISDEMRLTHVEFATSFAEALTGGDYGAARKMLSAKMQQQYTEVDLQESFEDMIAYGASPARVDGTVGTLEDWAGKTASDIGWVYVSVSGDDYGEAVTVVVSAVEDRMVISSIDWGRP